MVALALRSAVHVHLGFGSFGEYVERLFGYRPRSTQEKLRVATALEHLPDTAREFAAGALSWSAVRELSRVAVAETEREWLELARGKSVHEFEAFVAGKIPGERPCTPARVSARRHVLRIEVAGETLALWREAMDQLRRSSNCPLDDDSALLLMARHVLGGPRDEGRANYQIALYLCSECGKSQQQASGEFMPISSEVVAMAHCDGQHLGFLRRPATDSAGSNGVEPANKTPESSHRSVTNHAANATRSAPAHTNTSPPVHTNTNTNERRGTAGGGRVSPRDQSVTSTGRSSAHVGARARQSIAPATRRAVRLRDNRRCVVPGCRNARFLDLHHIELSSEGGGNEADNLVTLCAVHHRAVHRGALAISGSGSTGVVVRHADGRDYGGDVNPSLVETLASTFVALRGLGFREGEIRRAQAEVANTSAGEDGGIERLLRAMLTKLTSGPGTRV